MLLSGVNVEGCPLIVPQIIQDLYYQNNNFKSRRTRDNGFDDFLIRTQGSNLFYGETSSIL